MPTIVESIHHALSQYVVPLFAAVIALAIAILLHEFGHFIVARLAGIRAEVFSIGFGKKLWSKTLWGTEFQIASIPIGGYVLLRGMLSEEAERYLLGEEEEDSEKEGREESAEQAEPEPETVPKPKRGKLTSALVRDVVRDRAAMPKKAWPLRVAVFAAGCGFNFLVAATLLSFIAWVGTDEDAPFPSVVGEVREGSAVYKAGLREGDRIVQFARRRVEHWGPAIADMHPGILDILDERLKSGDASSIECVVRRGKADAATTVALMLPNAQTLLEEWKAKALNPRLAPACIGGIAPFSPASKAGLKKRDVILAIDDQPIDHFAQMVGIVSAAAGRPLQFHIRRGRQELTLTVTPKATATSPTVGRIGIISGNVKSVRFKVGFFKAWPVGFRGAWRLTKRITVQTGAIFARFNFREIKDSVAGPVGIIGISFQEAREGWEPFLRFMAFLNIALMICNLLPIPILDGGRIVITTFETVARRPIPLRVLIGMSYFFALFLLSLLLMFTVFDVMRFADFFGLGRLFQ